MSDDRKLSSSKAVAATVGAGASNHEAVEEELRQSQKTLASIYRAAPTGIGLVQKRVFLSVNQRLCTMLGYSEDELLGKSARMLYETDEEFQRVGRVKYRQIEGHGIGTVETRWVGKDGRLLDILLSSAPLDPEDRAAPVSFTALDISARKKATADLERSEKLLRTITDTVGDSVFVKDLNRRYTFVNKAMADTLGATVENMIGKTPAEIFDPRAAAMVDEVDSAALAGERVDALRTLSVGGRYVTFHTVQAPLRNEYGEVVAICGIVRDVTDQRRAEEERLALLARVQQAQKLESLGVLAGGIAHDFNNLLVGVLGNAEVALLDLPEGSPGHSCLNDIKTTALRAGELVRQMMAYSGKGHVEIETVELPAVVNEIAHLLEASVSKNARLRFDFAPDTPVIEADVAQLRQVAMNLLTNASDAIGERPGVINLRTGLVTLPEETSLGFRLGSELPAGPYAYYDVTDTGCGMPEDNLSRVFDPFFSTKFTGRGLGLAVVLGIVRSHHGAIEVKSEVGLGSTFRVLLPASLKKAPRHKDAPQVVEDWRGSGTVLLVDDEDMVRTVGKRILERLGFDVVTAADGHQAISLFREDSARFCCVLLDLAMPVMDGEECCRALRKIQPSVRVILSSGFHEDDVKPRFDGLSLAGFIHKPYRYADLQAVIRKVVGDE